MVNEISIQELLGSAPTYNALSQKLFGYSVPFQLPCFVATSTINMSILGMSISHQVGAFGCIILLARSPAHLHETLSVPLPRSLPVKKHATTYPTEWYFYCDYNWYSGIHLILYGLKRNGLRLNGPKLTLMEKERSPDWISTSLAHLKGFLILNCISPCVIRIRSHC